MSGNVKVVSRFRPPNALELREGGAIVVDFDEGQDTTVRIRGGPTSGPEADGFTFDRVFPMNTRQQDVFEYGIKETVDDVINGYNGTIFAYGQTGSGKTFTMMGASIDDEELKGIIPRITKQIFDSILESPPHLEYLVKVSYMEIYMERIRDLLAPHNDNLQIHEDKAKGVYVKGLSDYYVGGQDDVYEIMRQGGEARAVSSTNMNAESSRSHSIFLLTIQQKNTETGTQKTGNLYLVDLAGSEKVGKTGASGQTLEEAKKINKSLSALGMVINALTDGKSSHIPYRDSKLTRILQESLGGNSRTTLIINASPCAYNQDETISTLRFGVRAKSIKNKARVNAELSPAELKALLKKAQAEAAKYRAYATALENEVKIWRTGGTVPEAERAEIGKAPITAAPSTPRPASVNGLRTQTPGVSTPTSTTLSSEAGRELSSRPETPTAVSLEKDERDEFLRRENELADQVTEKENAFKAAEAELNELREELAFYKEQEATLSAEHKTLSAENAENKIKLQRIVDEQHDLGASSDILKQEVAELKSRLEEARRQPLESGHSDDSTRAAAAEDLAEKQRQQKEKVERMMNELTADSMLDDTEAIIRDSLNKLEQATLTNADSTQVKSHLLELTERHRALSSQIRTLQGDYDDSLRAREDSDQRLRAQEKLHDELLRKIDSNEAIGADELRSSLEASFAEQKLAQQADIDELRRQAQQKAREINALQSENQSLRAAKDELRRAFDAMAAGVEGGQSVEEKVREMEIVRRDVSQQLSEFESMKKSLMRDLQNRCEKVVELEISLDESREQYNSIVRSSNTKAQRTKMSMLERNLEQLTNIQRQLVEQNSSLKREVVIAERKLGSRNERIHNLESMLADTQDRINHQNARYEAQMALVRERFENARNLTRSISGSGSHAGGAGAGAGQVGGAGGPLAFGRIAKPLRGGGSQAGPQPGPTAVAAGAPRHPGVTSVQQQAASIDSKSPKSRSSWFFSSS